MSDDKCKRCGECCRLTHPLTNADLGYCKHLKFNEDGTTTCLIYDDRINKIIYTQDGVVWYCTLISKVDKVPKDCAYEEEKLNG